MKDMPIPLRVSEELVGRIDRLATALTARASGAKVARSSAMRVAIERGLDVLEVELGIVPKRKK